MATVKPMVTAAIVAGIALGSSWTARAQDIPNGALVMRSDGAIFLVIDGQRRQVDLFTGATDDAINALPEGERIANGVLPLGVPLVAGEQAAPAPTPPAVAEATPEPDLIPLGQELAKGNWSYVVTRVERGDKSLGGGIWGQREAVGEYVIVYLTIKSISKRTYPIHMFDFHLWDAENIEYDPVNSLETNAWLDEQKLDAWGKDIPPGVPVDGALVFEVGPQARNLNLWVEQAGKGIDLQIP